MNGFVPETAPDDDALLQAFRPCLRYDSQAVFLAMSPASMTDNPGNELRRRKTARAWADGVPPLSLTMLSERGHTKRDRLRQAPERAHDALRLQRDPRYGDRVYGVVRRSGDRVFLQYWLFFYGTENGSLGARPRDDCVWRLIQVDVERDGTAKAVIVENERLRRRRWRDVPTIDGHPIVYVAPRLQYLYFEPGMSWRGFDYDGSDGAGREVVPRVSRFTGWETWPGRWGGDGSPAMRPAWDAPQRVGHTFLVRLVWISHGD